VRQQVVAPDDERDARQDLKEHASRTAALERRYEMADPSEDQQPAHQQCDPESRHGGLDDGKHSQHDEQDGGHDQPT